MTREDALRILESKPFHIINRRDYNSAIKALKNPGTKVYCGKRITVEGIPTSITWQYEVINLFRRLGFTSYEAGNDAPRKGRQGDYIKVF